MVFWLRVNAWSAAMVGYAGQSLRSATRSVVDALLPTRHWTERQLGSVVIKVPASWSEVEHENTGPVVYNRPRRFRVDGDAVWYSTAVEIRVRHRQASGLSAEAPMTEICHSLPFDKQLVLAAAVANGLSRQARRTVDHILKSARPQSPVSGAQDFQSAFIKEEKK